MYKIKVPEGTHCPLCPDHEDEEFVWSDLMLAPICTGCSYDIANVFDYDGRPMDEPLIDRIEDTLGISFEEAKAIYLEEEIRLFTYWQRIEENLLREKISREKRIADLQDLIDCHGEQVEKLKSVTNSKENQ